MLILKQHRYIGISMALENHCGTFDKPAQFHAAINSAMPVLSALLPIRERMRLIVGDLLKIVLGDGWAGQVQSDAIAVSTDPIVLDTASLLTFAKVIEADGTNSVSTIERASWWLASAAELELCMGDIERVELFEINLR